MKVGWIIGTIIRNLEDYTGRSVMINSTALELLAINDSRRFRKYASVCTLNAAQNHPNDT